MRRVHVPTSPFLDHSTPVTSYEKLKFVINFPLLIIRLFCIFVLTCIGSVIGRLASLGRPKDGSPLSRPRRLVLLLTGPVARAMLFCLGFYWIPVDGYENYRKAIKEKGFIIVFNHISMVDSPLIVTLFMPSVLAKEDVLHYPIIGPFLRSLDMLYVKRESANSGGLAAQIKVRATDKRYNGPLAIAPEGTCSNGKCLLSFRTGAFVAGVPVLPVLISYPHRFTNPAWTMQSAGITALRILTQFANFARVRVLPLYRPSEEERARPEIFRDNVRALMARELGVPLREETLEDSLEMIRRGITVSPDESKIVIPKTAGVGADGIMEYEYKPKTPLNGAGGAAEKKLE